MWAEEAKVLRTMLEVEHGEIDSCFNEETIRF